AGGMNAQDLFAMGAQQQAAKQQAAAPAQDPAKMKAGGDSWTCSCGAVNTGKFCAECGSPKPEDGWTCECGAKNKGKFCTNCGKKKPAGAPLYKCDKCGWEPEDPYHPPKFCPECGDPFDENDQV
ncbi:MAG: SPFH domain-containing protein, partial [Lachnospiraceae bacterium]|nr:SPFH domain-containing protein [Lachnospiraceae bacterium]